MSLSTFAPVKTGLSIFFIILIGCSTFTRNLIVAEYTLNKAYIAANLCINKARPAMNCQGKCQLKKKMAEEEKQNNPNKSIKFSVQEVLFAEQLADFKLAQSGAGRQTYTLTNQPLYDQAALSSIFHPPALT